MMATRKGKKGKNWRKKFVADWKFLLKMRRFNPGNQPGNNRFITWVSKDPKTKEPIVTVKLNCNQEIDRNGRPIKKKLKLALEAAYKHLPYNPDDTTTPKNARCLQTTLSSTMGRHIRTEEIGKDKFLWKTPFVWTATQADEKEEEATVIAAAAAMPGAPTTSATAVGSEMGNTELNLGYPDDLVLYVDDHDLDGNDSDEKAVDAAVTVVIEAMGTAATATLEPWATTALETISEETKQAVAAITDAMKMAEKMILDSPEDDRGLMGFDELEALMGQI